MPCDYEFAIQQQWILNRKDVVRAIKAGELDNKIDNFCSLHGFNRSEVIQEIIDNPILQVKFAKDPITQRIHEKTAAAYIESLDIVKDFEYLPNNSLAIAGGMVRKYKEVKEAGGSSTAKTIDFKWKSGALTFYAYHKYTRVSGGNQGNQYKDLQAFIKESRNNRKRNEHFIAIADGNFYQDTDSSVGLSRIEHLQELAGGGRVHACVIDDLEDLLKKLISY